MVLEASHATTPRFLNHPPASMGSSSFLIPSMASQPSSRSSSPGPQQTARLPVEPTSSGGITHHRPAFVHASTSLHAPPTLSIPSLTDYSFPPEKEHPPDLGVDNHDHAIHRQAYLYQPNTQSGHSFAHASRASSRRSSLVPVPETCFLSKARDKILGKEGGMGRALVIGWVITTLGFVIATAFWKGELFGGECLILSLILSP
jgi:hypothetical protein